MSIWDALDEGHGAAPFSTEPSAYEQHLAAERQKRELKSQIKRFGDDAMRVDPTLPLGASGAAVPKETEQFERGYVMRMPGSKAPKQESKDPLRSLLKAMQITGSKSQSTPKSDGTKCNVPISTRTHPHPAAKRPEQPKAPRTPPLRMTRRASQASKVTRRVQVVAPASAHRLRLHVTSRALEA
jgi:hypothetical protein